MRNFAGSTPVIYLTVNKTIRNGVKGLIGRLYTKNNTTIIHVIGVQNTSMTANQQGSRNATTQHNVHRNNVIGTVDSDFGTFAIHI